MTAYLLTATGVIFLTVVIGFIVPEGKLNKSVNFVLRLACIFVLIQPVTKIFDFSDAQAKSLTDYEYICSVYSQNQSEALTDKILQDLDLECDCVVSVVFEDGKILENGVTVNTNFVDDETIKNITEYLKELGYINITVNEKTD